MKRILFLLCIFSLVIILCAYCFGQSAQERISPAKEKLILKTLMEGINSGNRGCCAGCTYMMGELCCEGAVIPLLSILHGGKCEEVRIMAALSLYKINDARGIFAIKQAARFDDSERVKRMCGIFYNAHLNRDQKENEQIKNIVSSDK